MLGVLRADRFLWGRQDLSDVVPELTAGIDALVRWMLTYVLPDPWDTEEVAFLPVGTICGALPQVQCNRPSFRQYAASYSSSKQVPMPKHPHAYSRLQCASIVLPQLPKNITNTVFWAGAHFPSTPLRKPRTKTKGLNMQFIMLSRAAAVLVILAGEIFEGVLPSIPLKTCCHCTFAPNPSVGALAVCAIDWLYLIF